ncbi:MAG: nucleoside triphosphate pyrophosphohydrolase [bacterium]|nr:nucleoside triphosphate pyrophosphohydrolase [bacterium]
MDHLDGLDGLVAIMDRLREPGGCPWDREQTYETLRGYLIEECYEVAEALDHDDPVELCEELGDLLFQIVFLSRLAKEQGRFTVDDVVRGIAQKMIRRHPHVFGDASAETSDDVLVHWEAIKQREKAEAGKAAPDRSVLDGVPSALPGLLKAQRLGAKASRVGFDWKRAEDVLEKIDEELAELRRAVESGDHDESREELGDLLFSLVNLARRLDIDPEGAIERANHKFGARFRWIERTLADGGREVAQTDLDRLEQLWAEAKAATRTGSD